MLVAVLVMLWRYPSTELVVFHSAWIGLAVVALRAPSPRAHSWALVGVVTGLALVIEINDVRAGTEGVESIVEIALDLVAFLTLVYLARRHRRALEAEHDAAVAEHRHNERQRAFFANASHALRTPITIARGHAELALKETMSPIARADVGVILEELDRLTVASYRILKMSVTDRLDPQSHRPVEVDALVRSTVERWRPAAPRVWTAQPKCGGITILADVGALTEALDALIDNAVAATSPGSAITVCGQMDGRMVVLSVADDGLGIAGDPEDQFDAFERGPRRCSQASGGTGLGLSIVRTIARSHGGDAAIASTPGQGTTVRLTIPAHRRELDEQSTNSLQTIAAL